MDELAHSNPVEGEPAPRHAKRWQDVEELLAAGIDVYTTVNVQHIESLNDIVAGITGVRMQETVPDVVFESADEVELVDITPDELLERLHDGKVYIPEQARHAIDNFFRKGNLIALRELALRTTADRVDAAMREYREGHGIRATWAAGERLLVARRPGRGRRAPGARRQAHGDRAARAAGSWSTSRRRTCCACPRPSANRRIALLRLAESLGAEAVTLGGSSAGEEIANYARTRNVTRILIGRPRRALWRRLFRPSTYGELLGASRGHRRARGRRRGRGRGAAQPVPRAQPGLPRHARRQSGKPRWPGYAWAVGATAVCTALGWLMSPAFELVNIVMVYLLGGGAGRRALRPRTGGRRLGARRRRVRFLLRAAAAYLRGVRHAVPGDLRHHARGRR